MISSTQFWILAATPSVFVIIFCVLVISFWMQQRKRIARLETQCDTLAVTMNAGFLLLNKTMNQGFEHTSQHLRKY